MTAPTLRLITGSPDDDGPGFLEPPTDTPTPDVPTAPTGPVPGVAPAGLAAPDGAPGVDWVGTVRVRRTLTEVAATIAPAFVPPAAAAAAWLASGGNPLAMMGVGCGVGVAVMGYDRRRTRGNRWSTLARPPQGGRRRTDAERARDMAATAAPAGTAHRA